MLVVIFRAKARALDDEYLQMARRLRELALTEYGCVEFTAVTEATDEIALSYWRDEASLSAWRRHAEHLVAQQLGKTRWYESYQVQVARIEREYRSP